MKSEFFKFLTSKEEKEIQKEGNSEEISEKEEYIDSGFTKEELAGYDENARFFYINLINSLILYTYDIEKLDKMAPVLFDPLAELYEELDYAFLPVLFETVFRNKLIDENFKEDLLIFRKKVEDIPAELWDWDVLDSSDIWQHIRIDAEDLLNKLKIETRTYNTDYTTIISK